jgi:predicted PurR-regulated permease PerM
LASHDASLMDEWTFRRVVWATLILVFVALSFWLIYRFNQVVFILFIAILLGTVIRPVVTWLHRRGLPRKAGAIFFYLFLLGLVIGFLLSVFPMVFEQGATIASSIPSYYQNLREWIAAVPYPMIAGLGDFLPTQLPGLAPPQQTGEEMLSTAGQLLGYLKSTANVLLKIIVVFLLAFHWTLDGPRIIVGLLQLIPKGQRENMGELVSTIESKIGFFIAGQSVLCLVIGILALIAYLLIGLPNALVLAILAGIMEAVPMVGPLLGAIPAGLIALSISPIKLVWLIVATVVIQQLENILLVPRVMRKAVGVNPFVSLLSIFAFSALFGIVGALMAIPIAVVVQLILQRFVFHPAAIEPEVLTDRDFTSRLRYEAQDLAKDLRKQSRLAKDGSDQEVKQIDRVMDEIESIATDLDALLADIRPSEAP